MSDKSLFSMEQNLPVRSNYTGVSYQPATYQPAPDGDIPSQGNPFKTLHRLLRRRYWLLIVLAGILAPAGAWLGYKCGRVTYRCVGLIRVLPTLPAVLQGDPEKGLIPMFEEYIDAEVIRLKSQRVIDLALQDPDWQKWKWPLPDGWEQTYSDELDASRVGTIIRVSLSDPDKQVGRLGVSTLIHAYIRVYNEEDTERGNTRLNLLNSAKAEDTAAADDLRSRINVIANKYGNDNLQTTYLQQSREEEQLQAKLDLAEQASSDYGTPGAPSTSTPEQMIQKVAAMDPRMLHAVGKRDELMDRLEEDKAHDLGDNNPEVETTRKELALVQGDIKQMLDEYRQNMAGAPTSGATSRPDVIPQLKTELNQCKAELLAIGRDSIQIRDLQRQVDEWEKKADDVQKRIDELNIEGGIGGRMEVVSDGDPLDPKDTHYSFAGLGGACGALMSLGFVLMLGLRDRRVRSPEDTPSAGMRYPMLGMLPTLSSDLSDNEQAAMAAYFVHGIRAMLQIKASAQEGGRVLAITSPSSQNGKTSLTLALGVSFAGAKSRTLMIDCDFVGQALTARINPNMKPRLGAILRRKGYIDETKLREGLDRAAQQGQRLGDSLMELGYLDKNQMDEALKMQTDQTVGMPEAISGDDLDECVAATAVPNLSILPVGQATPEQVGSLSPAMLRQLLTQARQKYDIIVVDTGPILGSLEAAMVATQADDVVVVLSSGENRQNVERSWKYLESVQAPIAGFVFNRATPQDFHHSQSARHASVSTSHWREYQSRPMEKLARYGPMAQAVAASVGDMGKQKKAAEVKIVDPKNGETKNGDAKNGPNGEEETHDAANGNGKGSN